MDNVTLARRLINPPDGNWQPLLDHLTDDVVFKVSGATVSGSEYADVLDFRDGRIARFLVIQDLSPVVDAYRTVGGT